MGKPITKEGYNTAKERLQAMKKEFDTLPEVIAEAREKGDLKENAEYHAARERQGLLKAMIAKLENDLAESEVIDPASLEKDIVTFGKHVKVLDKAMDREIVYRIVGELESDLAKNEITVATPVAKGLMGKKVGDTVSIVVPAGEKTFEILSIDI